ncbi:hypothetical protein GCM10020000_70530 [Streptomyces olivoverticillatus]
MARQRGMHISGVEGIAGGGTRGEEEEARRPDEERDAHDQNDQVDEELQNSVLLQGLRQHGQSEECGEGSGRDPQVPADGLERMAQARAQQRPVLRRGVPDEGGDDEGGPTSSSTRGATNTLVNPSSNTPLQPPSTP